jgi:hypothetical protein
LREEKGPAIPSETGVEGAVGLAKGATLMVGPLRRFSIRKMAEIV